MPRLTHTYPLSRNQCGYCSQAFPTLTGLRRHTSHSPRCQAAALRSAARRHTARSDQGVEAPGPTDNEATGQGIETYADIDMYPDPFLGHEGDEGGRDDHGEPVRPELERDSMGTGGGSQRYAREFDEGRAADVLGSAQTAFESMKDLQEASGRGAYAPFADRSEWELADWLVKNTNQGATDKFLKLAIVSDINQCSK